MEPLGAGGMGEVYRARDEKLGRDVAVKVIDCYSLATQRLEPLVDLEGLRLASWVQVPWMGLAPDDSPLVVADRGTRDLYALEFEAP